MIGFTSLEIAVLAAICEGQPAAMRDFIETAEVTDRENNGHGFYTLFSVDRARPALQMPLRMINGPDAHMNDMGDGMTMGFILWLDHGYPNCLEGFQFGDATGETVDLKQYDLHALTFTRLEPPPAST